MKCIAQKAHGAKTSTQGGGQLGTVKKNVTQPMQEKQTKNISHLILTESDAQIITDTNNKSISKN